MAEQTNLTQNILYWAQFIITGFIFPLGVLTILSLIYMKISQYVDKE